MKNTVFNSCCKLYFILPRSDDREICPSAFRLYVLFISGLGVLKLLLCVPLELEHEGDIFVLFGFFGEVCGSCL